MTTSLYPPVTTPCTPSAYAKDKNGYPRVGVVIKGRTIPVLHHRLAYAAAHNMTPADMKNFVVIHKCDNPGCINPEHLMLTTQAINMRDMGNKGRSRGHNAGELPHNAKITKEQVLQIRTRKYEDTAKLAVEFNVSRSAIGRILNYDTWKDI